MCLRGDAYKPHQTVQGIFCYPLFALLARPHIDVLYFLYLEQMSSPSAFPSHDSMDASIATFGKVPSELCMRIGGVCPVYVVEGKKSYLLILVPTQSPVLGFANVASSSLKSGDAQLR